MKSQYFVDIFVIWNSEYFFVSQKVLKKAKIFIRFKKTIEFEIIIFFKSKNSNILFVVITDKANGFFFSKKCFGNNFKKEYNFFFSIEFQIFVESNVCSHQLKVFKKHSDIGPKL